MHKRYQKFDIYRKGDFMNIIERIGEIPRWDKYEPQIQHYSNFSTNITSAAIKISDVNRTFCTGRASFIFYDCDDFGQLVRSDDELSKLYFRSILIYNSLSSYNICIDLSWQVVWLYLSDFGLDTIYDKKKLNDYLNSCTLETLNYQLVLAKESKIRNYINEFFNEILTQKIRRKYNYYKHKGAFHVPGLGINYGNLPFGFNNLALKQFSREEFDLDEWVNILIDFHLSFMKFFEGIINFVIPTQYLAQPLDFKSDTIEYGLKVQKYFENKNE